MKQAILFATVLSLLSLGVGCNKSSAPTAKGVATPLQADTSGGGLPAPPKGSGPPPPPPKK